MNKILVIEDSRTFATIIQSKIHMTGHFSCDIAPTFKDAKEKLLDLNNKYFIAVVDLNLPDARYDEVVDYVISKEIPVIVYTSEFSDEIREKMISKKVIDYILKKDVQTLDYLINTIVRIYKNQFIKILIVDDSSVSRQKLKQMLEIQKFTILEAKNGVEALYVLKANPQIKLILTDYNMPEMDGFELISKVRENYSINQLAIIGISAYGSGLLSIKFLKIGANDFIIKPFVEEELYLRIKQNIEMLEYLEAFQQLSNIDYLTELYNRRYFFEMGNKLFENSKRKNVDIIIGMIDIDNFKSINDKYGHEVGDLALKSIANILVSNFRSGDIVCRYGGEEFCVLAVNMKEQKSKTVFERIRNKVENFSLVSMDQEIKLTVSIGVSSKNFNSLEEQINHADNLLYKAKNTGKNKVINE